MKKFPIDDNLIFLLRCLIFYLKCYPFFLGGVFYKYPKLYLCFFLYTYRLSIPKSTVQEICNKTFAYSYFGIRPIERTPCNRREIGCIE